MVTGKRIVRGGLVLGAVVGLAGGCGGGGGGGPTRAGAPRAPIALVSVDTGGTRALAGAISSGAVASADGRYVVFASFASNLVPGGTAGSRGEVFAAPNPPPAP